MTWLDILMNHFHLQLIPRYAHEKRGSRNFVKERQAYVAATEKVNMLRKLLGS